MRIALIAAPLGTSMRDYMADDIRVGLATGRFRIPSPETAADLILGFGLMGMRSVLRGEADTTHAENVAQAVWSALGVKDAARIAHRSIEAAAFARRAGGSVRRLGSR